MNPSSVFVSILLSWLVTSITVSLAHSELDSHSDVMYTICSSNSNNLSLISKHFTEHELVESCRQEFLKGIMNKISAHHHHDDKNSSNTSTRKHPSLFFTRTFIYGFIAVLIVSALSLVGLLALPILYKISFKYVLNFFTAIAIGTLFGDAMFHLVPVVLDLHNHNHKTGHEHHDHHHHQSNVVPSYQWKLLFSVLILYIFYLLETFLHWFAHYKHDHRSGHSHDYQISETVRLHDPPMKNAEMGEQYSRVNVDPDIEHSHMHHNHTHHNLHQHLSREATTPSMCSNGKARYHSTSGPCSPLDPCSNDIHITANPFHNINSTEKTDVELMSPTVFLTQFSNELTNVSPAAQPLKTIKSTGWMVLFGDSIHNFADGLAISAAFSQSTLAGITTTIAVACHELPHELGDYAVLLQSGFSHYRALLWNFLSATTAIFGFFIGSLMSDIEGTCQWIFAATIGMFLYIALVDLLPTLLTDGKFQMKRFLVVNIGFLTGITIMFLLAIFEDRIIGFSVR